ncbi:hypothetical protein Efla_004401 [Eimeria flavescens]
MAGFAKGTCCVQQQQEELRYTKPQKQQEQLGRGLDAATMDHLQQQLLEDDAFAEDMRAVLIARFRAKHRSQVGGALATPAKHGSGEVSLECSPTGIPGMENSDEEAEETIRLKRLGHEIQAQDRALSEGTSTTSILCWWLLQKLEELKYTASLGGLRLRRVPFVETLAVVAQACAGRKKSGDLASQIDAAEDLRREAAFLLHPVKLHVQKTIPVALSRLRALGLRFSRSPDFLAEMLKSDSQMGRIRARIDAEQEQQRQFERKRNQRLNKKINSLSGHQIVREQEVARRRNMQLRAIDQWRKERQAAIREGFATTEAEDEFDQWLLGNEQEQGNITPNHRHPVKPKRSAGRRHPHGHASRPRKCRGKLSKSKGLHRSSSGQGKLRSRNI